MVRYNIPINPNNYSTIDSLISEINSKIHCDNVEKDEINSLFDENPTVLMGRDYWKNIDFLFNFKEI